MVEIDVKELLDESVKFTLSGCSLAFANSLRRVLMSEIPTIAIEIVEYDKNYTVFPEEMTADRLGLIPIDSRGAEGLRYPGECNCNGICRECAIVIELDVSNTGDGVRTVTSADLVVEKDGPLIGDISSPSIITKLGKNQSIKCRCVGRKGVGKTHVKWSPVSAVSFGYDGENKLRHTKYWHEEDVNKEWPVPWFMEGKGAPQSDVFLYGEEPSVFYFKVEVVRGCLEPLEVLRRGIKVLEEKIALLINSLP